MDELSDLERYQAIVDEAIRGSPPYVRQKKAGAILAEALKFLSREEFNGLQDYVFERLEK